MNGIVKCRLFPALSVFLVVLGLGLLAGGGYLYWKAAHRPTRLEAEFSAKYGMLPGKSEAEIQDFLDQVVDDGMVNIKIATEPVFDSETMTGRIALENVQANHYWQQVTIKLSDTDEVLASSGIIKPGQYVQDVTLGRRLEPGNYKMTAVFTTYYPDDNQDVLAVSNIDLNAAVK